MTCPHFNMLTLDKPLKINITCQGIITIISPYEFEYKNSLTKNILTGLRRFCGFEIIENGKSVCILKSNFLGSFYYNKDLEITYKTSFFRKRRPRSFLVRLSYLILRNKEPLFNLESQSYSLNFNGRVSVPSVKNFQLVHPTDNTYNILTFGKIGEKRFVLDYRYPLSALTAFCICLAALDRKYLCD
ncbi:tubby-related protein 1 [Vairimorpha necatrix]|uniref:Tubby-related protein 1 n=1 Tax=Vairimorpha necatrix TaxID=6039 RepID=A0AAX4J819_9MICR